MEMSEQVICECNRMLKYNSRMMHLPNNILHDKSGSFAFLYSQFKVLAFIFNVTVYFYISDAEVNKMFCDNDTIDLKKLV
jgi:hypothetical protein